MSKYARLDDLILQRLQNMPTHFNSLHRYSEIERESDSVATPNAHGDRCGWRVVDRRLQAMRKAGILKYSRADGWSVRP